MSVKRRFTKHDISQFCYEGRVWARAQNTTLISKLWALCPNGSWMAWYLYEKHAVTFNETQVLAHEMGIVWTFTGRTADNLHASKEVQKAFADLLRTRFTSTGRARK